MFRAMVSEMVHYRVTLRHTSDIFVELVLHEHVASVTVTSDTRTKDFFCSLQPEARTPWRTGTPLIHKSMKPLDLNVREGHEGYQTLAKCETPVGYKTYEQQEKTNVGRPALSTAQQQALTAKRQSKALALATKPGQQMMMNAFMMYMSGSQLNIFSINTTSMAILTPVTALFSMDKTFGPLGDQIGTAKAVFIGLNLLWLAVGLYKMSSMRLLPTTSADWTSKLIWKEMMETTSIPPT